MTETTADPWDRKCGKCGTEFLANYSESCPNCGQVNSFYAKLPADKIEAQEVQPLERENARLRKALVEIEALSPTPSSVGQIARDALRIGS